MVDISSVQNFQGTNFQCISIMTWVIFSLHKEVINVILNNFLLEVIKFTPLNGSNF